MLEIRNISKHFPGGELPAVDDISFSVADGELLSPWAKAERQDTLLRLIAGLEKPTSGTIHCAGRCFAGPKDWIGAAKRGVGLVFQGGALFPHMTAEQTSATRSAEAQAKAPFARPPKTSSNASDYPASPSATHTNSPAGRPSASPSPGTLAARPKIILLDEPYSNLDVVTTSKLRDEIRGILKAEKMTGILVTHDPTDACHFGDRVAIVRNGKLEQIGSSKRSPAPLRATTAACLSTISSAPSELPITYLRRQAPLRSSRALEPIHPLASREALQAYE